MKMLYVKHCLIQQPVEAVFWDPVLGPNEVWDPTDCIWHVPEQGRDPAPPGESAAAHQELQQVSSILASTVDYSTPTFKLNINHSTFFNFFYFCNVFCCCCQDCWNALSWRAGSIPGADPFPWQEGGARHDQVALVVPRSFEPLHQRFPSPHWQGLTQTC